MKPEVPVQTPSLSAAEAPNVLLSFRRSRIILPVLLGVAAVCYLFYTQFNLENFREIDWNLRTFSWIGLAFLLLVLRHIFYAFRMNAITAGIFSWRKCMELIVLWEFSAAITPTSKGGPFVMLFVLTKEKLAAGRTAAAVFYTIICDSGFFIILLPILLGIYGPPMLFPGIKSYNAAALASGAFFATYGFMCTYWLFLVFAIFVRPQYAQKVLEWLSRRPLLKKRSEKLVRLGAEFRLAAEEIRTQQWRYHAKVIIGTIGAWTCKFLMINMLIVAIEPSIPFDGYTQAFLYARLVAMFIIMSFSPTPGGAGLAEVALQGFIADYVVKGKGLIIALLWRAMAYYGYLLLGAIITPRWIAAHLRTAPQPERDGL